MTARTVTVQELEQKTRELLRGVIERQETLKVVLGGGEAVEIRPSAELKPLPILEGTVPSGWKNAINEP